MPGTGTNTPPVVAEARRAAAASFYHLTKTALPGKACRGLACFVARHLNPGHWQQACAQDARIYCLGKCYAAPAVMSDRSRPRMAVHSRQPVVLERIVAGGARPLAVYGGYKALEKVRAQAPEETIKLIESSNLRGRGGAGFPTGRKWRAVFSQPTGQKYVVANADEGDPAAYIDRFIIEDDPHVLIEAMAIAGHAVGANKGYIYLRKEYPHAIRILGQALAEARAAGYLDEKFDLELFEGHGAYICGEETALLNSIEGRRAEVRSRPPYPTEKGLWDKPTIVNNVETFANIPWIVNHGVDAYRALGFSKSQGTKVVSLNSLFKTPGLYEVDFGCTVRDIVEKLGGGLQSGPLKGVIIGGPLAGILPPELLDTKFGFEELRATGAMVGHGGILAFDEHTSIAQLVQHIFSFSAYESCGKCTPCREGGWRVEKILARAVREGCAAAADRNECREITAALLGTSLCGLGTGMGEFMQSVVRYYGKEWESCFA